MQHIDAWSSTNRGSTWRKVSVRRSGSDWVVDVRNPASGTVSLRANVADASGNTTATTVIDAYAIA